MNDPDRAGRPGRQERLLDLLERWQALEAEGQPVRATDLCADCPELAGELEGLARFAKQVAEAGRNAPPGETPAPQAAADTAPAMPAAGAQARYEFGEKLGEGGMGAVYRARDRLLGRDVAIKVIRPELLTAATLARFEAEARAVARLDHPHIIKVFDVGESPWPESRPAPYLALEFVPGGSLARRLGSGAMTPLAAARLVAILARAMAHAHERGVVHRDLKPDNVLLAGPAEVAALNTELGCPKITDFGLAREVQAPRLTGSNAVLGTPAYMAPEQADGLPDVGPPADVWALGVTLYRLLAGRLPFESDSVVDLLYKVCREEPPALRALRPDAPPALASACADCMRKRPECRPTARELAARLEAFSPATEQPETVSLARLRPLPTRRRFVWAGAGGAGVALAAGLAWALRSPPGGEAVAAPRIKPIVVNHYEAVDGKERHLGRIGERSPRARWGDRVTLTVELAEPAYFYVAGFNFDGGVQLLWPAGESEAPQRAARVVVPAGGKRLWLNDKAAGGLQAYAVAASASPLPPFAEWRKGRALPWRALPAGEAVWEADAKGAFPVHEGLGADRGEVVDPEGAPPLAGLCEALKAGGVEAVEAVAFPVLTKEVGR